MDLHLFFVSMTMLRLQIQVMAAFLKKSPKKYNGGSYERKSNNKQTWNFTCEQTDANHGNSNDSLYDATGGL